MITKNGATLLLALLCSMAVATAQPQAGNGGGEPTTGEAKPGEAKPARPTEAADARIDEATAMVAALKGTKGPERLDGMRAAAAAFEAVARDFAAEPGAVAKALWEAGECWRRAGDLQAAADAYGRLLAAEPGNFRQRACFERASMLRRLKQYDEALALYEAAAKLSVEGVRAHDARIWIARVHDLRGDPDASIAAYRAAVDAAVGARRTIEACDACAKAQIRRGELDAAQQTIERAASAAKPEIDAGGREAEALQRRLDEMGSRRQLQRARDKANDAGGDAVKLDEARRG